MIVSPQSPPSRAPKLLDLFRVPSQSAFTVLTQPLVFPLFCLGAALMFVPRSAGGVFSYTGCLGTARSAHTATLLANGLVLVTGGTGDGDLASAELYDSTSGTWTATGSLNTARSGPTATLLPNGMVLVTGGSDGNVSLASAELYDPTTGTWSLTGNLNTPRAGHTATLLPNGLVLVAGGLGPPFIGILDSTELYNPATEAWTISDSLKTKRFAHTATLLPNGLVLVAGGQAEVIVTPTAELYDPAADKWSATGELNTARLAHTATLLPSGLVLVSGGKNGNYRDSASAELYDPAAGVWTATGDLSTAREIHTATLLLNGMVLAAGGNVDGGPTASAELYNPAGGLWSPTGYLNTARDAHTATLLPNGMVLVTGGEDANSFVLASSELYSLSPTAESLNMSTRLAVGTGDNVLIGGFIIRGNVPKTVLLRAIGPSLANANPPVPNVLADPVLELHEPDGSIAINNNWKDSQEQAISDTGIPPTNDLYAALLETLAPGAYTAIVSGNDNGTGVALIEAYDLQPDSDSKLANISSRGRVQAGDEVVIGGFILGPEGLPSAKIVVRALGPSLTSAGVVGALQNPELELHDSNGNLIASNDNWKDDGAQRAELLADNLAPSDDHESAMAVVLAPGAYTAIVNSKEEDTTGIGLVEVYNLQ
jgi:hypothetical protein